MTDRQGQRAAPPPTTSQTQTQTASQTETQRILRLRGHNANGRSVQWAEDVVDNEGLGRKTSKVCCIYHKPKGVDESSDESSSSSSGSDTDSEPEPESSKGDAKKVPACDGHSHGRPRRANGGRRQKRPPSPNAYEKVPKQKPPKEESK